MNKKIYTAIGTVMLLSFSSIPFVFASPYLPIPDPFTDVKPKSTYYDALFVLKSNNIVSGYPDGSFKPNNAINRAEFTKIIVEASSATPDDGLCTFNYTGESMFTDVSATDGEWYVDYICYAKLNKLINGYPDGSFKPMQNINFTEASKIIANAFQLNANLGTSGPWYNPYVNVLFAKNAVPKSIKSFGQNITRGEMAEMAYRIKFDYTNLPSQTYEDLMDINK